ncbi:MAG: Spy/CpxP family protein refolding chaperone [Gallionella sp.]|nr:Spy/CpxP family protein refolding chaperone [Gallionella sp.]
MNNGKRIFSFVLAAALFGAVANLATADSEGSYERGYGMGPGMMGGYGGYGMGPEMMGGHGMGSGMMGSYGRGYGMDMMGDWDLRELNLTADQKDKLAKIRKAMRSKMWPLMGEMMDIRDRLHDLYDADKQDATAINKQYEELGKVRKQMVDNAVDAHNRINDMLTPEQRKKHGEIHRGYGPKMRGR